MKKLLLTFMMVGALVLTACGSKTDSGSDDKEKEEPVAEAEEESTTDKDNEAEEKEEDGGEDVSTNENGELTLQLLKQDEEDGLTLENNELYQAIAEEVEADPLMGEPNDLSLYPFDIVEFEDGTSSLMFLVINRLDKPIKNIVFDLTFGNKEDDTYIFEGHQVDLPEDYLGGLDKDGVVPILLEIEEDDEALYSELTMDNVLLELENVGIDFEE